MNYGIFTDEGCIEDGFIDEESAHRAIAARYPEEDDARVLRMCDEPDHEEQAADSCELCNAEDDDEEDGDLGPCEMCGGQLGVLGQLGGTLHLQCRNCGMAYTRRAS